MKEDTSHSEDDKSSDVYNYKSQEGAKKPDPLLQSFEKKKVIMPQKFKTGQNFFKPKEKNYVMHS